MLLINSVELNRSFIREPKKDELCALKPVHSTHGAAVWVKSVQSTHGAAVCAEAGPLHTPRSWTATWFIQKAQEVHTEFCRELLNSDQLEGRNECERMTASIGILEKRATKMERG